MRSAYLVFATCIAFLAVAGAAFGSEAWTLDSRIGDKGKSCSLSRVDQGRPFSITVAFLPDTTDQGVVGLMFEDPKVVRTGTKTLAIIELDDGTRGDHRLEAMSDGASLIPIVTSSVQDVLRDLSESGQLRVTTRVGTTSFSLDGIADHISDLRRCAGK